MISSATAGSVRSVNVSAVRWVTINGAEVRTAIKKTPVVGRVALTGHTLAGDEQADLESHGGPDRAVYAYAAEDYAWWSERLGRTLLPGIFGENLTLSGIDVSGARIGEQWQVGSALLAVTSPRVPCAKLAHALGERKFVRDFAAALRPGAYLRVVTQGEIGAGDTALVVMRPEHNVSVAEFARIYFFEHHRTAELLRVPELTQAWRDWAGTHGG